MFISTLVHLVEIILLSLLGIMFYKLFASYRKWKSLSVSSSSPKGGDRAPKQITPALPQNPDYLSISRITVTEEQSHNHAVREKQSSVILKDYIGEFFAESKPMDLSPYREEVVVSTGNRLVSTNATKAVPSGSGDAQEMAAEPAKPMTTEKVGSECQDQADEFIQVKPLNLSPVILAHSRFTSNNASLDMDESIIPTLNELVDGDSEAYITVASNRHQASANNIMSDKVVLAMLDEAKLVCAS